MQFYVSCIHYDKAFLEQWKTTMEVVALLPVLLLLAFSSFHSVLLNWRICLFNLLYFDEL